MSDGFNIVIVYDIDCIVTVKRSEKTKRYSRKEILEEGMRVLWRELIREGGQRP